MSSDNKVVIGIVATLVVIFVLALCLFLAAVLTSRRRRALLQRHLDARRREQRDRHFLHAQREALRRQRVRQALARTFARGDAAEGIVLASRIGMGNEVPADRPLRAGNAAARPPPLRLRDGTCAPIARIVAQQREGGGRPDALPGPQLLQLIMDSHRRQQQAAQVMEQSAEDIIAQLQEMMRREAESSSSEETEERDTTEEEEEALVYGKGFPYVLNPANSSVAYRLARDSDAEEEEEEAETVRRFYEQRTVPWLLTPLSPLLKRKNTHSTFEAAVERMRRHTSHSPINSDL